MPVVDPKRAMGKEFTVAIIKSLVDRGVTHLPRTACVTQLQLDGWHAKANDQ